MSSSGMGGDVNSLMLSIQQYLCRAARMQFFFLDSSKYLTFGRNYLRLTIGLSISEGQIERKVTVLDTTKSTTNTTESSCVSKGYISELTFY